MRRTRTFKCKRCGKRKKARKQVVWCRGPHQGKYPKFQYKMEEVTNGNNGNRAG